MKDKILEIIERTRDNYTYKGDRDGEINPERAADEICQMMADEIVKVMKIVSSASPQEIVNQVIYLHNIGFTEEQIDNALNKLK